MKFLHATLRGVVGFFVDDGAFAAAVLAAIAGVWICIAKGLLPPRMGALLLPVGFAVMLVVSVWRMVKARL